LPGDAFTLGRLTQVTLDKGKKLLLGTEPNQLFVISEYPLQAGCVSLNEESLTSQGIGDSVREVRLQLAPLFTYEP
jgi:hypothetical protein